MPHGKFFIGLPVISGINIYANNQLSYNDVISRDESGTKYIDVEKAIESHGTLNVISGHVNLSLFHLAFRLPEEGPAISFFVNERVESDITYPSGLLKWLWRGNGSYLGRNMNFNSLGISTNYFREYGIGIATNVPDRPITVGMRLKMYQGIVNVSTPASMKFRFQTSQEHFQLELNTENAVVRTAGVELLQGGDQGAIVPYLINNPNKGVGVDIGIDYKINRYYQVALSATDLGFISWNNDIRNYSIGDTTVNYSGIELRGSRNLEETVFDSLIGDYDLNENSDGYLAPMVGKLTGSWIYTPMKGVDIISTVHTRIVQNQPKMAYGVGVRGFLSPRVIGAASITKVPQQWVNIGAAFSVTAGFAQFYASADKVLGYSVPNMHWAEFRLGMNLVFGLGNKEKVKNEEYKDFGPITDSKGIISNTFMGEPVKVKRQDGIYTIIKKQTKRDPATATPITKRNDHLPNERTSATPTRKNSFGAPNKPIGSATGSVNKNDRSGRRFHSASGANRSDYKGNNFRSASGSVNKNDRVNRRRIKSATGRTIRNDHPGVNRRSATGSVFKNDRPNRRRIRSASGEGRNDHSGGRKIKSATGSTKKNSWGKRRKIKSATGKNRNSKGKKRRNN